MRALMTHRAGMVLATILFVPTMHGTSSGQRLVNDQLTSLKSYVLDAIQPSGLVRDSLQLDPTAVNFHPASPDAAGFALLAIAALDHVGHLEDADSLTIAILSAHAGKVTGVTPGRSADGHFVHFMDLNSGYPAAGGWDTSYSPISSALLIAAAQFSRNHFQGNATIAALADQLASSVDFNAAVHPSLNGSIFLDMGLDGGGVDAAGVTHPWNEFSLVVSLGLRQQTNDRALAVRDLWLDPMNVPKISYGGIETLTDDVTRFAPAFWVQQGHFFNPDFRHNEKFESFFRRHQWADRLYTALELRQPGYGLTSGVSPAGYYVDRIKDHPFDVSSPEAVSAWGDLKTLRYFAASQDQDADPRYRYGLVRMSAQQPDWIPTDAGLVDHLFLLFGLVERKNRNFFSDRLGFLPTVVSLEAGAQLHEESAQE